ncbi:MAG: RNA polymerase sigma factor [Candidatus Dormibacteria bacterium]
MDTLSDRADPVWHYGAEVQRPAEQLCRHPQDAEDVAQSTLVQAASHMEGFRGEASLRTWLHRIATNECRQLRRRRVPLSLESLLESNQPYSRADGALCPRPGLTRQQRPRPSSG